MSRASNQKPKADNRSTIIKGFIKPSVPGFPGVKPTTGFKPTGRFQTINRSRR